VRAMLKLAATVLLSLASQAFAAAPSPASLPPQKQQDQESSQEQVPLHCAEAQRRGDTAKIPACLNAKLRPRHRPGPEGGAPLAGSEEIVKRPPNQLGIVRGP
jgi:hypothetical protein